MRIDKEKMRELRNEKLLTQEELAKLSGLSFNTVYRFEHGLSGARQSSVKKIARVLGVAPQDLLLREESGAIKK